LTKVTLNSFGSDYVSKQNLNANNTIIQNAFENTLSRDGTSPNAMGASLDMNGHRILNLPAPVDPTDPVRMEDIATTEAMDAAIAAAAQVTIDKAAIDADMALITAYGKYEGVKNFFGLINNATIIAGIKAGTYTTGLDSYMTTALSQGGQWYFPPGSYYFNNTINMPVGFRAIGAGIGNTIWYCGNGNTWAIQQLNSIGGPESQAFSLYDLEILPTGGSNGIRFNSISGGFTDDPTSQGYLMRAHVVRCRIAPDYGATTQIGLQLNKTFDSDITDNYIHNWGTNIDLEGSDINRVEHNRLQSDVHQSILVVQHNTFGSSNRISHNDILAPHCALVTSDRDGYFCDNYVEGSAVVTDAILVNGGFNHKICNNRIEWDNASNAIHFDSNFAANPYGLIVEDNHTSDIMGNITFFNNNLPYFTNSANRLTCSIRRNTRTQSDIFIPLNSKSGGDAWKGTSFVLGADYPGISAASTDPVYCQGSAVLIPTDTNAGHYIEWSNWNEFGIPGNTLTGSLAVSGVCYADTAGKVLSYEVFDGGTSLAAGSTTIGNANQPWYFPLLAATGITTTLKIRIWCVDNAHAGNVFVQSLSVQTS
jgi:hypothetical protein